MRLLHIADLHIGKRVCGMLMIDEQLHVIDQLSDIVVRESIDAVLVAGDVFDRTVPSREALETCEELFSSLHEAGIPVFVVPGNHDSPQQLSFCSGLLSFSGLHIAKAFDGSIDRFLIEDGDERVWIHLLPFVRPTDVRMALPDQASQISSHDGAVRAALSKDVLEDGAIHVLVAHQFVTSASQDPQTCDSEVLNVGGSDNVDASAFDAYDYVALGHLHGPQSIGRETLRYAGSPLKYSFSEVNHKKSATIVNIEDGKVTVETRELTPLHDMREVSASYEELAVAPDAGDSLDYMRVTLTDRSLPDAMAKLRVIYPNILRLDWTQFVSDDQELLIEAERVESATPLELFQDFYRQQTGLEMTDDELAAISALLEEASQ